jgi:F-type H+-transporting ATPase subunit epsilon
MPDALKISVVTPEGSLFAGEALFVAAPAWDGEVGILPGHAAMIAILGTGELRVERGTLGGKVTDHYAVRGGFLQVIDNEVTLLVTEAKKPDDLDLESLDTEHADVLKELQHPPSDPRYAHLLDERRWIETRQKIGA